MYTFSLSFGGDQMNGYKIQNDGTVNVLGRRLSFIALQHQLFVGDSVPLDILREGKVLQVEVTKLYSQLFPPSLQYIYIYKKSVMVRMVTTRSSSKLPDI